MTAEEKLTTNNPFAELAKLLRNHDCHGDDFYPAVDKAQCIIEELAKVKFWRSPISGVLYACGDVSEVLKKCRTIAEEKVNND